MNERLVGAIEYNAVRDIFRRSSGIFILDRSNDISTPHTISKCLGEKDRRRLYEGGTEMGARAAAIDTRFALILSVIGTRRCFIKGRYGYGRDERNNNRTDNE